MWYPVVVAPVHWTREAFCRYLICPGFIDAIDFINRFDPRFVIMEFLQQRFSVQFEYKVFFTNGLFSPHNPTLGNFFEGARSGTRVLMVLDDGVVKCHPSLVSDIRQYFAALNGIVLAEEIVILPGGEQVKNDEKFFYSLVDAVNKHGIDRHSYLVAIGGGSILDVAGYAAAVSHRGIRHVRIPTTVLSQNDSGVGVKNGINYFSKKNFLGTFATPAAVFNDSNFLTTLDDAEWRSGISEAIKVALIKDAVFFDWLESNAAALYLRDMKAMQYLVHRCAAMHMEHIAGKDPFESGSSRPLDFGHWSAHKLEQLSNFALRHGEAVAIGIALDTMYSHLSGRLSIAESMRIIKLIEAVGLPISHPLLQSNQERNLLLDGLNEFREHLGGRLTIMLLRAIGKGEEVNEIDSALVNQSNEWLIQYLSEKHEV
jgi:3-dehydroquinate synthase